MSQLIENIPEGNITDPSLYYDVYSTANYTIRPSEHVYIPYTCTFEMTPDKLESIIHRMRFLSSAEIIVIFTTDKENVGNVSILDIHNMTGSDYHIKEGDRIGQLNIFTFGSTGQ